MLDPCFTAMLDGAVMANNPPVGLAAVPDNGATNAATTINAIFAALPHANTNTRNVYFFRPTTRYFTSARLDITVDGTQVMCGGNHKVTLRNQSAASRESVDAWFRGSGLSPNVRMENVEHVLWHGGGWRSAASQAVDGGHIFEMATTRFGVLSNIWAEFMQTFLQANGLGAGDWTELCFVQDGHMSGTSDVGGDNREMMRFGGIQYRANSGKSRCCGTLGFWGSGSRTGTTLDEAEDCLVLGGYSEGQGLAGYRIFTGALRCFFTSGMESVTVSLTHQAGSTGILWGITGGPTGGSTDFHTFHWNQ